MSRVAVIGGGPAGMLAAAFAARNGHQTLLFEKNEKLGKKLYITGKGRCNITNAAPIEDFFAHIERNAKFLYSALYGFDNHALLSLLSDMGVPTKVERGARVFPVSDKSSDIIRALERFAKEGGAEVALHTELLSIEKGEGFRLTFAQGLARDFDAIVLATGGKSYPSTGSTGDGYRFARALGHSIVEPVPSLVPVETEEDWPKGLMGLSLRNVRLSAFRGKRKLFEEQGEMLFTHFGLSGPLVLHAVSRFAQDPAGVLLRLDMKPALDLETLDKRLLRDFEENRNRHLTNALGGLLPARMVSVAVALSGIEPQTPVHALTREQRLLLCRLLKNMEMHVRAARPFSEAIITRGGVCVKEVDASTMQSKLVPGLYFAGELLDVDAATGGYNLQIACSTGVLAGRSIE